MMTHEAAPSNGVSAQPPVAMDIPSGDSSPDIVTSPAPEVASPQPTEPATETKADDGYAAYQAHMTKLRADRERIKEKERYKELEAKAKRLEEFERLRAEDPLAAMEHSNIDFADAARRCEAGGALQESAGGRGGVERPHQGQDRVRER